LALLVASGCSSEAPGPPQGPLDLDTRSAKVAPTASAPSPAEATRPWKGEPIGDKPPPGVKPLEPTEAAELDAKCKPLESAVFGKRPRRGSSSDAASIGVAEAVLEVLESPPPLAGIDVARCTELLKRDIVDFIARSREARAAQAIRTVLVGLADRSSRREPPCAAGAAVPSDIAAVATDPYESKPKDYASGGWVCAGYKPLGAPQSFQLELVISGEAYRVVARLYPVKGGSVSELYAETPATAVDPGAPILRRTPER
jgi:hypothetical protein